MVIGKVFPPKPVLDVFEIIVLLSVVSVVVVEPGGAAITVLFLSFAVAGLDVVLTGNPLELMEDEFRTFAALVSLSKLLMPLLLAGVDVFEIIVLLSVVSVCG
jgi:hypothetical protein